MHTQPNRQADFFCNGIFGAEISQSSVITCFPVCRDRQRGVVLFFTLIALLAMSLAAVALIRSVDTSALIAGNLAFKQSTTVSADAGIAASMNALTAMQNLAAPGSNIDTDATFPLNVTDTTVNRGYFAFFDPNFDVVHTSWTGLSYQSVNAGAPDASGNTVRFIIQRMCRISNVGLKNADCLLAAPLKNTGSASVDSAPEHCDETTMDCTKNGQPAQTRITVRADGPNSSVSYVQGFVF